MIRLGDSPESGMYNKFIDVDGDGHRGTLMAISKDGTKAIIMAVTRQTSGCGIVHDNCMYLVSETHGSDSYPSVINEVHNIPDDFILV